MEGEIVEFSQFESNLSENQFFQAQYFHDTLATNNLKLAFIFETFDKIKFMVEVNNSIDNTKAIYFNPETCQ